MTTHRPEPESPASGAPRIAALVRLLRSGEDWLVQQTLHYARCRGFSRFAPTLEAAWQQVVRGLTDALAEGLCFHEDAPELEPVLDLEADPLVTFVVREALLHQDRGLELSMFLGLFKYIRQAYAGFLVQQVSAGERLDEFQALLSRSFERMEVAICQAWTRRSAPELAEAAWGMTTSTR